jgi:hypothetical protein
MNALEMDCYEIKNEIEFSPSLYNKMDIKITREIAEFGRTIIHVKVKSKLFKGMSIHDLELVLSVLRKYGFYPYWIETKNSYLQISADR